MSTTTAVDTMTIARRLFDLCAEGRNLEAIDELYHADIVSVEAAAGPDCEMGREARGIDAIKAKNEWWLGANEVHERSIDGPFPHGDDRFALHLVYELTAKEGPLAGQRMRFEEVGVYTVVDGKVAREEYFYAMPGA